MSRRRKLCTLTGAAAALALVLALLWQGRTDRPRGGAPEAASPAEPLELHDLSGRLVDLGSQGDLVLLCFSSLSCPSCVQEAGVWRSLLSQGRQRGVTTVVVSARADPSDLRRYVAAYALEDLPMLSDREGRVSERFEIRSVPAYLLLDRRGRMLYRDLFPATAEGEDPRERAASILAAALAAAG